MCSRRGDKGGEPPFGVNELEHILRPVKLVETRLGVVADMIANVDEVRGRGFV